MSITFQPKHIKHIEDISPFEESIDIVIRSGMVPLLEGPTGVGKSKTIHDYGIKRGFEVIVLEVANMDPAEAVGRMVEAQRITQSGEIEIYHRNTLPTWFNRILENEEKNIATLLFLDEINRGPLVKDQLMSLILERRFGINERKLPDSTIIIAAQNPDDGDYSVEAMDPAQASRLVKIKYIASFDNWKHHFALKYTNLQQNIHPMIVEYLENFPKEFIVAFDEEHDDVGMNPRRWEMASSALYSIESNNHYSLIAIRTVLGAILGFSAPSFIEFYSNRNTMTLTTFASVAYTIANEMNHKIDALLKTHRDEIEKFFLEIRTRLYNTSEPITKQNLIYAAIEAYEAKAIKDEIAALIFMISSNENIAVVIKLNKNAQTIMTKVLVKFSKSKVIRQKKNDAALQSLINKVPGIGELFDNGISQ